MINITNKQNCCGCAACLQKCPKQCIQLMEDNEGFLYPKVDTAICVNCGLCEKVCPVKHPYDEREPIQTLGAINKKEEIRMQSSSGGIFTLLAEKVINEGGVVFGARFDEEWQVNIDYTESIQGISDFRGSKYVQARTGSTYKQCEAMLKAGRKVLYTGTPCQIAGLKHYLMNEYENLITVDIACHGVPSPKVWSLYIKEHFGEKNLMTVNFRDKKQGWDTYRICFKYKDDKKYVEGQHEVSFIHYNNEYFNAFNYGLIMRPSCANCPSKHGKSQSDITIADFWGIDKIYPGLNDNKGTSLVLINSHKGSRLIENLNFEVVECDYKECIKYNTGLRENAKFHRKRDYFFDRYTKKKSISKFLNSTINPPLLERIKKRFKIIMSK